MLSKMSVLHRILQQRTIDVCVFADHSASVEYVISSGITCKATGVSRHRHAVERSRSGVFSFCLRYASLSIDCIILLCAFLVGIYHRSRLAAKTIHTMEGLVASRRRTADLFRSRIACNTQFAFLGWSESWYIPLQSYRSAGLWYVRTKPVRETVSPNHTAMDW